jgi:4-aminobutyrate aminotransferase-like enzyme
MERGLITVSCGIYHNVLRHLIPLVIQDDELDEALDVMADAALAARGAHRLPPNEVLVEGD